MEKKGAAEHENERTEQGREEGKAVEGQPVEGEEARQEHMEGDGKIKREDQGKAEKKPVGRVKEGRLETREIGGAAKNVGVPKGQVTLRQLGKAEEAPTIKLVGQVPVRRRQQEVSRE